MKTQLKIKGMRLLSEDWGKSILGINITCEKTLGRKDVSTF